MERALSPVFVWLEMLQRSYSFLGKVFGLFFSSSIDTSDSANHIRFLFNKFKAKLGYILLNVLVFFQFRDLLQYSFFFLFSNEPLITGNHDDSSFCCIDLNFLSLELEILLMLTIWLQKLRCSNKLRY